MKGNDVTTTRTSLKKCPLPVALLCLVLSGAAPTTAPSKAAGGSAASWPQYRGPARNGISEETGLLKSWPPDGPRVVWSTPIGEGYSGMSVAGQRLYTMDSDSDGEYLVSRLTDDGKQSWRLRIDSYRGDGQGGGPRSTPTLDGDRVFALGANGKLVAADAVTGAKIWERDLKEVYGARVPRWGVSTSPLVEGELLVIDAGGGPDKSLVALDKGTGQTKWTAYTDRPGYSAPLCVDIHGVRQILSFTASSLISVAPADGKLLWSISWETSYNVNAAMPIFIPPDRVFISSSYDTGGAVYSISKSGDRFQTTQVWKNRLMKNHFNSSIHYGGYLYGFDDATLKCLDAATGQEKWSQRGFAKGSLLLADGHLIILSESGLLALAEATPEAYREKARAQILEGRTWTMPTLAGGRLYLRSQNRMVSLAIAG